MIKTFASTILFEDEYILAINKAPGLVVEASPFESDTIEAKAVDYLKEKTKQPFVGIVHRLDRVTSGVLLLAKKKSTLKLLNEQFSHQQIRKTYLALVKPAPVENAATLEHWLRKDDKIKRAVILSRPARQASACKLYFRVLDRRSSGEALLEVHPATGKFHQIRAQLAFVGTPIVGDLTYGGTPSPGDKTIGLHAWKLRLRHPHTQEELFLEAPAPLHMGVIPT